MNARRVKSYEEDNETIFVWSKDKAIHETAQWSKESWRKYVNSGENAGEAEARDPIKI